MVNSIFLLQWNKEHGISHVNHKPQQIKAESETPHRNVTYFTAEEVMILESRTDLPIFITEDCTVGHGVEEGPEGGVATAVVVGVEEVFLHRHRDRLTGEEAGGGCLVT